MKKILAIVMAVAMLMAMAVTVSAEEVLFSYDFMFFNCGNWETNSDITTAEFIELLATPGAQLVITRDGASDIDYNVEGYEKFGLTDSWYAGLVTDDAGNELNNVSLGTATHTKEAAVAKGNLLDVIVDCISDDGVTAVYDANAIYEAWTTYGFDQGGANVVVISNTSSTAYKVASIAIIVPDAPAEETPAVDETPVEDTPAEDTPAEDTPAEETPAETGLALAVVPMIVAAAAVALSKKR